MISVIIPTYNRSKTIKRSIDSVLKQTYQDIEIIVVDDCSTDDTESVIKQINNPRIRYERLKVNSGACVARNRGIELARGEFIAFQDSDDLWLENKLDIQLAALNSSKSDICFCALRRHYINEKNAPIIWPSSPKENCYLDHVTLRRKSYASTQTIIARKEVFKDIIFDPKVIKSQDYDWIIRASKNFKVYYLAEPLVEQYLQEDSISLSGYDKFVLSREYLLNKYKDICEEDPQFEYHLLQQLAHYKTLLMGNAKEEYKKLYCLKKNFHNMLCLILSKINLIKYVVK